jgi:predicted Zn-dependent peptidase
MPQLARLPNGLRVLTEPVAGVRSVALGLLVEASPHEDPLSRPGLAHLTEHALFCGTLTRSASALSRMMDEAGGQVGGFVTRDYSCYQACVPGDYATYALELLGDILLNSTVPAESVEREQQAILREIGLDDDSPVTRVGQMLKATIWPEHALGRSICGRPESILASTREDVLGFLGRHYAPDRMILAAAGAVDPELFVPQAEDALWRLSGLAGERVTAPCRAVSGCRIETADVSQAYFAIGLPVGRYTDPDRYALFVLNSILGGSLGSRLLQTLRDETGLVYDISSEVHAYRDAGLLVIQGATAPDRLLPVLSLVIQEVVAMADGSRPLDEEELCTARRQLRGQHLLASESTHSVMSRLLTQQVYFGRQLPADEILDAVQGVTLDDLARLVETRIVPALEQAAITALVPSNATRIENEICEFLEVLGCLGRSSS